MRSLIAVWLCLCYCTRHVHFVSGETFDECEGVNEGIFVASTKNCATYIYCSGADSSTGDCDPGQYFDSENQTCDDKENVFCPLDEPEIEETQPDVEVYPECEGVEDDTFVASSESCQTYIYCSGVDSSKGDCDEGMYFDSESGTCDEKANVKCLLDEVDEPEPPVITIAPTAAPIDVGPTTLNTLNVPIVVKATCPNSDDPNQIVLMANSESCSDYYLCYNGHATEMRCANQLHFNVNTGKCDYPKNVQCAIDRPNANKCLPHVTDLFPHPEKCNYYYYCIKGYLTVQQCPFYYGWDIERRSCVQITEAKCFGTSKRS